MHHITDISTSLFHNITDSSSMSRNIVQGIVTEGFQAVKLEFERNFLKGIEENAQLCVYFKGKKVVDLWGSKKGPSHFNGDTTTNIFSSTKVLTSICFATLVEKRLLSYTDKVVKNWPEYGNDNSAKEAMTVDKILRHEGGMPVFSQSQSLADIQPENIKKNSLGRIIEKEDINFPPDKAKTSREYHAYTRGTILNEIFRRVDPGGRTIGECLRQDIAEPLDADTYIGLNYEELSNSVNPTLSSIGEITLQGMFPQVFRKTVPNVVELAKLGTSLIPYMKTKPMLEHIPYKLNLQEMLDKFSYTVVKTGEIPSVNGQCSARGLAKVAAMMANKGEFNGVQIMSETTWELLHDNPSDKILYPTNDLTSFTQGGVNIFNHVKHPGILTKHNNDCRQGFIGWLGLGGSVVQWHPEYNIGFAYVPTFLAYEDVSNTRGALLQKRVVDCVKEVEKNGNL